MAPDVFVVLGATNADRPSYRLWEEDLPNLAETDEARQREKQARQEAETRLAREGAARHAAEARVAEHEALLQQARGGSGQRG